MIEPSYLTKLEEFRSTLDDLELKDEYLTNQFLYPYLKARHMDLSKAKSMVERAVEWRENNLKLLDWTPPKKLSQMLPYEFLGEDARGRPVCYLRTGYWDMKGAIKEFGRETYMNYYGRMLFQAYNRGKKTCKDEVIKFIQVNDYKDFKMGQLTSAAVISTTKEQGEVSDEYFPGMYYECIILRPSRFAEAFIKLVTPFMSDDLRSSLKCYRTEDLYKPELLKILKLDQLPKDMGGLKELRFEH